MYLLFPPHPPIFIHVPPQHMFIISTHECLVTKQLLQILNQFKVVFMSFKSYDLDLINVIKYII